MSTSISLWILFPFGLLFSLTGIWLLGLVVWTMVAEIGLVPIPHGWAAYIAQPAWQRAMGAVCGLIIAVGQLAFGVFMLQGLSATFDRALGTVTVHAGWMGLWRQRRPLSSFQEVCILHSTHCFSLPGRLSGRQVYFDIVLTGEARKPLVVGIVTQSRELAHQVVKEICEFTTLTDGTNQMALQS